MISQDPATLLALILVTVYAIKYATSRVPPGGGGVEEICKKLKHFTQLEEVSGSDGPRNDREKYYNMWNNNNNNNNEADRRQRLRESVVYFLAKMFKWNWIIWIRLTSVLKCLVSSTAWLNLLSVSVQRTTQLLWSSVHFNHSSTFCPSVFFPHTFLSGRLRSSLVSVCRGCSRRDNEADRENRWTREAVGSNWSF